MLRVKAFQDIFDTLPKSVVARDLGMSNTRFTKLKGNVDLYSLRELSRLAGYL